MILKENPKLVLRSLFDGSPDPDAAARAWGQEIADAEGLDPRKSGDQVRLIRALRQRDRSLDLAVATYLAGELGRK